MTEPKGPEPPPLSSPQNEEVDVPAARAFAAGRYEAPGNFKNFRKIEKKS